MTIALYTIVRDEHDHLPRLLEACEAFCDAYLICDTGSEDDTRDIARGWLETHPGQLVEYPWDGSFATALNFARVAAGELGCDYLYWTGASECPELRGVLPELTADVYMTPNVQGGSEWLLPRIHKVGANCEFRGRRHSFLHVDGVTVERLPQLWTIDHDYASDRSAKLELDRIALEQDHLEQPAEPRWVFYLGQTYRCMGDTARAAEYYHLRGEMTNGWDEERWYARYMEAAMVNSAHLMLLAYQMRPWRAEPLRSLAEAYRAVDAPDVATMFDRTADAIPYPENDALFIEPAAYEPRAAAPPARSAPTRAVPRSKRPGKRSKRRAA